MSRIPVLLIVVAIATFATNANAIEIRKVTEEAKKWEAESPSNKLERLQDEKGRAAAMKAKGYSVSVENGVVVLRAGWSHSGVKSQSTQERDDMAADTLFSKAKEVLADWNTFGIKNKTFGGVLFTGTEGGWSDTVGPSPSNGFKRRYKAGGTAVGFILVDP